MNWIKVPNEMPEDGVDVYIYVPQRKKDFGDGLANGYWDTDMETWYINDTDSSVELTEVSHWMEWIKPDPPEVS
jgi:hypothetical protein